MGSPGLRVPGGLCECARMQGCIEAARLGGTPGKNGLRPVDLAAGGQPRPLFFAQPAIFCRRCLQKS